MFFVCKYTGTPPGTPHHVISVAAPATTPLGEFMDEHDSYVLAEDTGQAKPDVSECQGYVTPPELCSADSDFPDRPADGSEGPCYEEISPPELCSADSNFPDRPADGSEGPCTEVVSTPTVCPDDTDRAGEPQGTEPCSAVVEPPTVSTPKHHTKTAAQAATVSAPATIPTTVHAGLVGPATDQAAPSLRSQGLSLALAGALALLVGGLGTMRRRGVGTRI